MGKLSAELLTSSSLINNGHGCPLPLHHFRTGSPSINSRGVTCFSTHRTFRSEKRSARSGEAADPYRTTDTRRSLKARSSFATNSFSSSILSPATGCASPARASPSEASEPASAESAAAAAESAATPAATAPVPAAAHHLSDQHTREKPAQSASPAAASSAADRPQENHQQDKRENQADCAARGRGVSGIGLPPDWLAFDSDAFRFSYALAELLRGRQQRAPVVALTKNGPDAAQHASGVAVRDDRLQSIADFHAILTILDRQQDQETLVRAFFADSPFLEKAHRDIFDRLAFERIDGHDGELDARGALHVRAVSLQPGRGASADHVGEVVHIARRLELGGVQRNGQSAEEDRQRGYPGETRHESAAGGRRLPWRRLFLRRCSDKTMLARQVFAPHTETFQASEHGHGHLLRVEELLGQGLDLRRGYLLDLLQHFIQREEPLEVQFLTREISHAAAGAFHSQNGRALDVIF